MHIGKRTVIQPRLSLKLTKNICIPDIVGVTEIENCNILENPAQDTLPNSKDHGIIQYDSDNLRGMDVALLYKKALFYPLHSAKHKVIIYRSESFSTLINTRYIARLCRSR